MLLSSTKNCCAFYWQHCLVPMCSNCEHGYYFARMLHGCCCWFCYHWSQSDSCRVTPELQRAFFLSILKNWELGFGKEIVQITTKSKSPQDCVLQEELQEETTIKKKKKKTFFQNFLYLKNKGTNICHLNLDLET